MAASDARPVPRKNAAWRVYFAIRKSDGTLITSWTGADSEVSKDGGSFADCTDEATEVGTSGCGYLDLSASEMNADAVTIKITVTNTGALPLVLTVFPEEAGDYRADVTHFGGSAGTFSGGRPEVNTTHWAGTAVALATFVADVTSIKAKTDNLPADPADASDIAASFTTVNTKLDTIDDFLDTEIAAIKAKTDNLPTDPADQSAVEAAITAATTGLATSANQTTILDRQAYTLAVLAGACSDPQTASETYVLTIGGSTYTVDMAGQTSTGTRTAPTLTKT